MPKQWVSGYEALAWIAWRSKKAVKVFSGKNAEELWIAARAGSFPKTLGKPVVTPQVAEQELRQQMQSGAVRWSEKKSEPDLERLTGKEAIARLQEGETLYLDLENVMTNLGRAGAEALLASLQSGEVTAYRADGRAVLKTDDFIMWMADHPQHAFGSSPGLH